MCCEPCSVGEGLVDFAELAAGLTVLCGGSRSSKIDSAFALYDKDSDGCIAEVRSTPADPPHACTPHGLLKCCMHVAPIQEELQAYLAAVYRVVVALESAGRVVSHPEELAAATAQQCFAQAQLTPEGTLSLHAFKKWYADGEGGGEQEAQGAGGLAEGEDEAEARQRIIQGMGLAGVGDSSDEGSGADEGKHGDEGAATEPAPPSAVGRVAPLQLERVSCS